MGREFSTRSLRDCTRLASRLRSNASESSVFSGRATRAWIRASGLLPPTGGSAYWNMCETRPFHTDSIDIFTAAALNSAGQMLYVEMSGPTTHPFPLSSHAELWLGGAGVFAPRQKLLTLYHDHLGIDLDAPGDVNWLTETTWLGTNTFLAIGGHLFPGDSIRPRGLVLGTITASGATISVVPGTANDSISHFGLISSGSAIVFVDSTAVIRRVDVASGATQVMATLPASAGKTLDISCRPDACVVLTSDGAQWGLWKLDLASGDADPAASVRARADGGEALAGHWRCRRARGRESFLPSSGLAVKWRGAAGVLLAIAAAMGACHSEPFGNPFIGAIGPLVPGPEERLTFADTNEDGVPFRATGPHWSSDGGGILYSFSPRPYLPGEKKLGQRCVTFHVCRPAAADPADTCLAMLPPTGGSAYWNLCESRPGHSNVDDYIWAGDINSAGQILYTEWRRRPPSAPQQFTAPSPPIAYADLWLATPTSPIRRELCWFSGDPTAGGSLTAVPACGVDSIDAIQWSGTSTFAALAGSILLGTITSSGVTFTKVPGTGSTAAYAMVDGGRGAIFVGGDSSIRHVTFATGSVTVVATLPVAASKILDVGCHPDMCVVLANGTGGAQVSNLWKVTLATGIATIVRSFDHHLYSAKLSPVSGDVVALEGQVSYLAPVTGGTVTLDGVRVYLLTAVLP